MNKNKEEYYYNSYENDLIDRNSIDKDFIPYI